LAFYLQKDAISLFSYFILYSGLPPPVTVLCKDILITDDIRFFIFIENFDGAVKFYSIAELNIQSGGGPITVQAKVTKIDSYSSNL
jgi:hypothetical protein